MKQVYCEEHSSSSLDLVKKWKMGVRRDIQWKPEYMWTRRGELCSPVILL